ncbi:hypothetical protein EKO04_010436 [Ascochyta lentis]|uniref:Uncharacterized protein n=1 Tax=Ascochyta lentis TaxID=205686 RepID=A0A8H7MFV2_9PLEO|nr:hypothetical protein EKO04_010436 [Ascochyta lentis]
MNSQDDTEAGANDDAGIDQQAIIEPIGPEASRIQRRSSNTEKHGPDEDGGNLGVDEKASSHEIASSPNTSIKKTSPNSQGERVLDPSPLPAETSTHLVEVPVTDTLGWYSRESGRTKPPVYEFVRPKPLLIHPQPAQEANRTSLEVLQNASRAWQDINSTEASQVPLPDSETSSHWSAQIDPPAENPLPLGSSLERLEIHPEEVPLPPRRTAKRKKKKNPVLNWVVGTAATDSKKKEAEKRTERVNASSIDDELKNYRTNVERLAAHFANFGNVAATETRHQWSSRIVVHDRMPTREIQIPFRQEPFKDHPAGPTFREFYARLRGVTDDCVQRIVLVEDLTPSLIDLLGATFDIPPHVFEEHLDRSGFKKGFESREDAKAWHTRSSAQGYSSVMWYRPVLPLIPVNSRFRSRLIRDRRPEVRCPFDGCHPHDLPLGTTANIWRHHLELCPEPGVYHKGSQTEYPVGWEEKATIWKKDIDGCDYVIVLLDPLPVVTVSEERVISSRPVRQQRLATMGNRWIRKEEGVIIEHTSRGRSQGGLRKRQHVSDWVDASAIPSNSRAFEAPPLPPHFGQSSAHHVPAPPLPSIVQVSKKKNNNSQLQATGNDLDAADASFTPVALRRRATRTGEQKGEDEKDRFQSRSNPQPPPRPPPLAPLPGTLLPPPPPSPPPELPDMGEGSLSVETHGPFVPYHPIKARSTTAAWNDATFVTKHMRAYIESLQIPKPTLDELDHHLSLPSKGKDTLWDPFRALFRAMHDDSHSLVDIIRTSLQRIREGTLDEDLMQKRVTFWRGLLHRLNFNLGELEQNLRAFEQFVYESETNIRRAELPSEKLARETRETLHNCMMLIDRSSHSLLAEMQIVDSRRSIAEAESVSKLTELAFVFIPLSFVASLFSMQVHELDGGVPAYQFALVAIGFVMVAYAVRLSIRSSHLVEYKNRVFVKIRDDSRLQYNESIPTHTFLSWVSLNFGGAILKGAKNFTSVFAPLILIVAIVAGILSPIVLLWLRGIDKGFTAVITVLLLLLDTALVVPIITNLSGKIEFNPKQRIREIQYNHKVNRRRREKAKRTRAGLGPNSVGGDSGSSDEDEEDQKLKTGLA